LRDYQRKQGIEKRRQDWKAQDSPGGTPRAPIHTVSNKEKGHRKAGLFVCLMVDGEY
jgi:hypothetical protein